jgi:hypothetical protein
MINGSDVEVPIREIPSLVKTLGDLNRAQLMRESDAIAALDGYMSYDECEQLLSGLFSDKKLPYHAGRLWGAMCRLTRSKSLHFDTKCTICSGSMEQNSQVKDRTCLHASGVTGYRMVLIAKSSIRSNLTQMTTARYHQVGESIKSDYLFIVNTL